MGYFKGIVNCFIESKRKKQDKKKEEIGNQIIEKVNQICKNKNVFDENEPFSRERLFEKGYRDKWRSKMVDIDLG